MGQQKEKSKRTWRKWIKDDVEEEGTMKRGRGARGHGDGGLRRK